MVIGAVLILKSTISNDAIVRFVICGLSYFEAISSLGDCSSSIVQLSALYQAISLQQLLNSASHRLLLPPFSSLTTSFEVTTGSVG